MRVAEILGLIAIVALVWPGIPSRVLGCRTDIILRTVLSIVLFRDTPVIGMLAFRYRRRCRADHNRFGPRYSSLGMTFRLFTKGGQRTKPAHSPHGLAVLHIDADGGHILVTMGTCSSRVLLGIHQLALSLGGFAFPRRTAVGANRNFAVLASSRWSQ